MESFAKGREFPWRSPDPRVRHIAYVPNDDFRITNMGKRRRRQPAQRQRTRQVAAADGRVSKSNAAQQQSTANDKSYNMVALFYNAEHKPYLYGMLHIIDGDLEDQRSTKPFIISRRKSDGSEVVYGAIGHLLTRVHSQVDRITEFGNRTKAALRSAGLVVDDQEPILPDSPLGDAISDEQEELIEDILLTTSVRMRILCDLFPNKLKQYKIPVLDYEDNFVENAQLRTIGNLIAHNKFMTIRSPYVVDLISEDGYLGTSHEFGLKFDFTEYLRTVDEVVRSFTVKDLVTKLRAMISRLSAASEESDFVFVAQNLYTLGGFVSGDLGPPVHAGPVAKLLERLVTEHAERITGGQDVPDGTSVSMEVKYGRPSFRLEPDLDKKQIRTAMEVNGKEETLILDYRDFFQSVIEAVGDKALL